MKTLAIAAWRTWLISLFLATNPDQYMVLATVSIHLFITIGCVITTVLALRAAPECINTCVDVLRYADSLLDSWNLWHAPTIVESNRAILLMIAEMQAAFPSMRKIIYATLIDTIPTILFVSFLFDNSYRNWGLLIGIGTAITATARLYLADLVDKMRTEVSAERLYRLSLSNEQLKNMILEAGEKNV